MNDDLTELLNDAVADVEPTDRLEAIRARTAAPAHDARRWWYAAGGVVLATAAAVTAVAVVTSDRPEDPGHHGDHGVADSNQTGQVVPVYFTLRENGQNGIRYLFREFDEVPAGDPVQRALERMQRPPADPDYRTYWEAGSFESAAVEDGVIVVETGSDFVGPPHPEGPIAQQLVYTLQGAAGERLPIRLVRDGEQVGDLYEAMPQVDVLNPVMISDPSEGLEVRGSFIARGAANSFEGNVPWEIRDEDDRAVVKGVATATGSGDRLYPWETVVNVSGLPFGHYTFVAMADDPSDGEGSGPFTDTRAIIVR